ncbi:MAG: hypothetical protein ACYCQJ_01165 [Nitrososphaerales archaeon]
MRIITHLFVAITLLGLSVLLLVSSFVPTYCCGYEVDPVTLGVGIVLFAIGGLDLVVIMRHSGSISSV